MTQVAIPAVCGNGAEQGDLTDQGGYVARVVDSVYQKVKPRWSLLQRELMERAAKPADDATLHRLLDGFPGDWANSFMRHNKLVGVQGDIGEFVPRLPVPRDAGEGFYDAELDAYNLLDGFRADSEAKKKSDADRISRVPKYYLHQIFSDVSVAEKLLLDAGMMIVVSRIAVADPKAACDYIVKHAHSHGLEISVRVGDYSTSRKASRQRILDAAIGLNAMPYTCDVIGKNIAVRGVSAVGSERGWTITAQLWQMPEVDAIFRLATAKGISIINTLFTMDMVKLGVELVTDKRDYGFDVQLHVGEYDGTIFGNRVGSFGEHVVRTSAGVFPVICDGKVMASAVYAGDRRVFVNWHVISGLHDKMREKGSVVSVRLDPDSDRLSPISLLNEVTSDVWLAEFEVGSDSYLEGKSPPIFRDAIPDEEVVAVYAVPTGVECTDSVYVDSYDMGTVCLPRFIQARSGMSGAALVAVSDGAVLGSYTGSNRLFSIGSALHMRAQASWLDAVVAPVAASHAFVTGRGADAVYRDLKARGLGDEIAEISAALKPLFSVGRRVGNQYVSRAGGVTVLDPDMWDFVDDGGSAVEFFGVKEGGVRPLCAGEVSGPGGRRPVLGEKVFSVHRDEGGVIFSDLLTVVWISPDGSKCRLNGVPQFEGKTLRGSVLVALGDCATLGMISKVDEASWGKFSECVTWAGYFNSQPSSPSFVVKDESVVKQGLFDRLASRFQCLKSFTWSDADIKALVVGDTPAAGAYSRVGLAATTATVLGAFFQQDVQGVEKMVASKFSDDAWMLRLCGRVLPGHGELFGKSCADKLNTLKIFLGLVYLREGAEALSYVLDELGLLQLEGYEEDDALEFPKFESSEFIPSFAV